MSDQQRLSGGDKDCGRCGIVLEETPPDGECVGVLFERCANQAAGGVG
jgi:hypothetical protein